MSTLKKGKWAARLLPEEPFERKGNEQTSFRSETAFRVNRIEHSYALFFDQPEEDSLCRSRNTGSV